MSHSVTTQVQRRARVTHNGRAGLTLAHVREFVAECEAAGISDGQRVTVEDKLAGEGANRSGSIEAWQTDTTPEQQASEGGA